MDKDTVSFFVPGIPSTSGSKRAFVNPKTGRAIVAPANPKNQKQWMSDVKLYAKKAMGERPLFFDAVNLYMTFFFSRPKGHYGTGRNSEKLKPSAPKHHIKKPDLTKLVRCTEDALKGVVWRDDCQVIGQGVSKCYGDNPGAKVYIFKLD